MPTRDPLWRDPYSSFNVGLPHLKGAFPFRLAATSYVVPEAIIPNIRLLGPYVDEVELVLFESGRNDNLPSAEEITTLVHLGRDLCLSYNVHLPTDLWLGDPTPAVRQEACQTVLRFYQRTLPLNPSAYILHLDRRGSNRTEIADQQVWLTSLRHSLNELIQGGLDPQRVAVENLDYPLPWIDPLLEESGLQICLDIGHVLKYDFDLEHYLAAFLDQTSMIHLHGLACGTDHRGLEHLPAPEWKRIRSALAQYTGGVCLEVFNVTDLRASMQRLQELQIKNNL